MEIPEMREGQEATVTFKGVVTPTENALGVRVPACDGRQYATFKVTIAEDTA